MTGETVTEQAPAGLPAPDLTVTLTYAEWCVILGCIGAQPLRDVLSVFSRLMAQLGPQADAQQLQAALAITPTASEARN